LVIAYASWISAAFHLKVIRVFLDSQAQQSQHQPYSVAANQTLTEQEADTLRLPLETAAGQLPKDKQAGALVAKLKSHFQVSYHQIPRARYTEALSLMTRHVADLAAGQSQGVLDITDDSQMQAARSVALEYFDKAREAVKAGQRLPEVDSLGAVLQGVLARALEQSRFLVSFGEGRMHVSLALSDAFLVSKRELPRWIETGDLVLRNEKLLGLAQACRDCTGAAPHACKAGSRLKAALTAAVMQARPASGYARRWLSVSALCHISKRSLAVLEYGSKGRGVVKDGGWGMVSEAAGGLKALLAQPARSSAQAVDFSAKKMLALSCFMDGLLVSGVDLVLGSARGLLRLGAFLRVLLLKGGHPALHAPSLGVLGGGKSDEGREGAGDDWSRHHGSQRQCHHMARTIGFMAALLPPAVIRAASPPATRQERTSAGYGAQQKRQRLIRAAA